MLNFDILGILKCINIPLFDTKWSLNELKTANIVQPGVESPLRADSPSINYTHYTGFLTPCGA